MGLLEKLKNGETDLKSLRFGNDRPSGGDSGQPFIKTPIPESRQSTGALGGDGILRGGILAPIEALEDTERLSKFFFNTKDPKGFLFTLKQNILSRVSAKTIASYGPAYGGAADPNVIDSIRSGIFNEGIYTPVSTLLQAATGYLGNHGIKQGLDPTGTIPNLSIRTYQSAVSNLISLDEKFNPENSVPKYLNRKINRRDRIDERLNEQLAKREQAFQEQKDFEPKFPAVTKYIPGAGRVELIDENMNQTQNYGTFVGMSVTNTTVGGNSFGGGKRVTQYRPDQDKLEVIDKKFNYSLKKYYKRIEKDKNKEERKKKKVENTKKKVNSNKTKLNSLLQERQDIVEDAGSVYYTNLLKLWYRSGLDLSNPVKNDSPTLRSYSGGPGSILGIGRTNIKFATTNNGITPLRTGENRIIPQSEIYSTRYQNMDSSNPLFAIGDANRIFGLSQEGKSVSRVYEALLPNTNPLNLYGSDTYFEDAEGSSQLYLTPSNIMEGNFWELSQSTSYFKSISNNLYNVQQQVKNGAFGFPVHDPLSPNDPSTVSTNIPTTLGATDKFLKIFNIGESTKPGGLNYFNNSQEKIIFTSLVGGVQIDQNNPLHQTWTPIDKYGSSISNTSYKPGTFYTLNTFNEQNNTVWQPSEYNKFGASYSIISGKNGIGNVLNRLQDNYFGEALDKKTGQYVNSRQSSFLSSTKYALKDTGVTTSTLKDINVLEKSLYSVYSEISSNTTSFPLQPNFVKDSARGVFNANENKKVSGPEWHKQQSINERYRLEQSYYNDADKTFTGAAGEDTYFMHPAYKRTRKEELQRKTKKFRFPEIRQERRVHVGDPGRYKGSYTRRLDKLNGMPVYKSSAGGGKGSVKSNSNDFVHFRIGTIDSRSVSDAYYYNFRALLTTMDDSFSGNWNSIEYMGRGETFKRYSTFERTMTIGWKVVAFSQAEMYGMYQKIRMLAASLAPTYLDSGYMTGNMSLLTIGGYVHEQPGIISNLTYTLPEEATWELTIGEGSKVRDELPMMLDVTMTFEPIYDFIPQFSSGNRFITNKIPNPPSDLPNPANITGEEVTKVDEDTDGLFDAEDEKADNDLIPKEEKEKRKTTVNSTNQENVIGPQNYNILNDSTVTPTQDLIPWSQPQQPIINNNPPSNNTQTQTYPFQQ